MKTIKHGDTWFIDDDNYDYSVEIQKAVDAGDFAKAAYLERSRNAKIDRFVMPYEKTYLYQDFLPKVGKAAEPISGAGTAQVPLTGDSDYSKKMNDILDAVGKKSFHYKADNDPLYKQIKRNYESTAGDVIENTMGTYAGMTGGMPSSYATSAAAQAGAAHLQKADDMIPELYQLAYDKYADDKADLYKRFSIMQGLEEQAYNREWDKKEWDYQLESDKVLDERYADETEWMRMEDEEEDAIRDENKASSEADIQIANALMMGKVPSAELIAASGSYDEGTTGEEILAAFRKDENKQNAAERVSNSFLIGVPPDPEDLALLNYPEGTTGEAALAAYKAANAPAPVYVSGGSGSADNLKRPTPTMFGEVDKLFEDGDGYKGIDRLKAKYDWSVYDEEEFDQYINDHYGINSESAGGATLDNYMSVLNEKFKNEFGGYTSAVTKNDDGTYMIADAAPDYLITHIFGDDSLSQEEKEYLIYDCLGITENQVVAVANDRRYQ